MVGVGGGVWLWWLVVGGSGWWWVVVVGGCGWLWVVVGGGSGQWFAINGFQYKLINDRLFPLKPINNLLLID